jgi:hypothetical protein
MGKKNFSGDENESECEEKVMPTLPDSDIDEIDNQSGGCPRCPGTPLGQKIPGGGYRAEKLFARAKIFSRRRAPPLAYFWLRHCNQLINMNSIYESEEYR